MLETEKGQVTSSAAEIYENFFIPALFEEWPPHVAAAAGIQPTYRVLDVACGTGILARTINQKVSTQGSVIGLDINEGMLAVARRKAPEIEWRQGPAEALPFPNGTFDAVVSQFGLMFFEDRKKAITEMVRVLKSGRRLAVAVWDRLENNPGYSAMAMLLQRLFGTQVADALRAPFLLGDTQLLRSLFADAGLHDVVITTHTGTARFPSIQAWIYTDIKGWTLADQLDDAQYRLLLSEGERKLQQFVNSQGMVEFSSPAHIVSITKA